MLMISRVQEGLEGGPPQQSGLRRSAVLPHVRLLRHGGSDTTSNTRRSDRGSAGKQTTSNHPNNGLRKHPPGYPPDFRSIHVPEQKNPCRPR